MIGGDRVMGYQSADTNAVWETESKCPFASVIPQRLQEAHALLKDEEKELVQE